MGSLYERLGGESAVDVAVFRFYRKVLADQHIRHFFDNTDMTRQAAKQKAFLTLVLGGPSNYSGRDVGEGHAHLLKMGLDDSHVDAVINHLGNTLLELGAKPEDVAEVAALAESLRGHILNRPTA